MRVIVVGAGIAGLTAADAGDDRPDARAGDSVRAGVVRDERRHLVTVLL